MPISPLARAFRLLGVLTVFGPALAGPPIDWAPLESRLAALGAATAPQPGWLETAPVHPRAGFVRLLNRAAIRLGSPWSEDVDSLARLDHQHLGGLRLGLAGLDAPGPGEALWRLAADPRVGGPYPPDRFLMALPASLRADLEGTPYETWLLPPGDWLILSRTRLRETRLATVRPGGVLPHALPALDPPERPVRFGGLLRLAHQPGFFLVSRATTLPEGPHTVLLPWLPGASGYRCLGVADLGIDRPQRARLVAFSSRPGAAPAPDPDDPSTRLILEVECAPEDGGTLPQLRRFRAEGRGTLDPIDSP